MPRTRSFGEMPDERPVTAYELGGEGPVRLTVLDLGAAVQRLLLSGADGVEVGVVLGHDDAAAYLHGNAFHGAVVGRYANRIAHARFTLDGVPHHLAANEGENCLHGGVDGFHRRLWTVLEHSDTSLTLELVSPDGDQGFPGTLTARTRYSVSGGTVTIDLSATTTATTVVSLTNHSYFNLAGDGSGTIDHHRLTVDADHYLPVDQASIPLGHFEAVAGTPFDLTSPAPVGERVRVAHPQVAQAQGVDHAFQLHGTGMRRAARLEDPASGRALEVHTDQPSLQVYTGNFLTGSAPGRAGRLLRQGDGIALETQRHPDAPNQPQLGEAVLRPGETYRATTQWRFTESAPG
jgi:aldose 1-epimerase